MKKKVKKTKTKNLKNLRKKMLSVVVAVVTDQEDVDCHGSGIRLVVQVKKHDHDHVNLFGLMNGVKSRF